MLLVVLVMLEILLLRMSLIDEAIGISFGENDGDESSGGEYSTKEGLAATVGAVSGLGIIGTGRDPILMTTRSDMKRWRNRKRRRRGKRRERRGRGRTLEPGPRSGHRAL